ncbi:hypothetical protein F4778DRAFT_767974 [Xylariomycetidae sp. FL2044]|nr:hypothetical protein F4778DRAFT_767974 [Xylariomycetidae sp. FL2044]
MAVEIAMNTPLADALNAAIQPKLLEVGWSSGADQDQALAEYIILMLVNGKSQEQIAAELSGELLSLGPDDPGARDFAQWLFEQIEAINIHLNGGAKQIDNAAAASSQDAAVVVDQDTEMNMTTDAPELNAPTGPKSMRNGTARGGREKRLFGHMAKSADRGHDSVLHRVRGATGNERINAHRGPPTGPRGGVGRGNNRMMNNRAAGINAGLNQMANGMPGMPGAPGGGSQQEQIFSLLQQQNQMMAQLQQQLVQQNQSNGGRPHGRSLFDRVQTPRGGRRGGNFAGGHRQYQNDGASNNENGTDGDDVDMTRKDPPNPDTTICRFNLSCTNKDCKFAHQSPAAPPGTSVDVNDVCSFGAACKNRKCVASHPSPAAKRVFQNEQDCPFKHPDMPACRNGGDCQVEGCKFTHLQTMCKFKPCQNRFCPYKHEEGQRGTFHDKVWTAEGGTDHVSERKFTDASGEEERILPGAENGADAPETGRYVIGLKAHYMFAMSSKYPEDVFVTLLRSAYRSARHSALRITRRPAVSSKLLSPRRLSSVPARSVASRPSIRSRAFPSSSVYGSRDRRRSYATAKVPTGKPREIAVLGGGITGLTTAHYLARYATDAHITLYEASDTLGGWVDVKREHVGGDREHKDILLQRGPRILRSNRSSTKYDDLVFYDVLASLGIEDKIREPPSASDERYLYYPDHLVRLPSPKLSISNILDSIRSFLTEPLWDGAFQVTRRLWERNSTMAKAAASNQSRPAAEVYKALKKDESVAEFFTRILGDVRPIENIMSGMLHGIYGGDVHKLSVKHTLFDNMWYKDAIQHTPGLVTISNKDQNLFLDLLNSPNRVKIIETAEKAINWNIIAFEDGLVTLLDGLVKDLEGQRNVTIKCQEPVTSLSHQGDRVSVTTSKTWKRPAEYDQIAQPKNCLPSLAETHAVSIMVVNLWYPNPNLLADNHGFGYLVPTSTPDNDECILGVIFDSDLQIRDERPGTKLTVMMGGHYWDEWQHLPTEEMAIQMAKHALSRHLGISETEDGIASARLCLECIPQHFVGHRERMSKAHYELLSAFKGQLMVAGPSYTSIGVIPAMRAGFDAAMRVARGHGQPWIRLENHTENPKTDSWARHLKELEGMQAKAGTRAKIKVQDHVGQTGLQGFTESLLRTLGYIPVNHMWLRKGADEAHRFTDTYGNWKEVAASGRGTIAEEGQAAQRKREAWEKRRGEKGHSK